MRLRPCKRCKELEALLKKEQGKNDILQNDLGCIAAQVTVLMKQNGIDVTFWQILAEARRTQAIIDGGKTLEDMTLET